VKCYGNKRYSAKLKNEIHKDNFCAWFKFDPCRCCSCGNRFIVGASIKAQIKVECRHPKLDYDYTLEQPNKLES